MSRIGMIVAAIVLAAGAVFADPLTYELVAVPGRREGSKPVGTITFAPGSEGSSSYNIATAGTEFDLKIVDFAGPPFYSWKSGDPGISAIGTQGFQSGVIGDDLLIPDLDGTGLDFPDGIWKFRLNADPVPDTILRLIGDDFSHGWSWQDFTVSGTFDFTFPAPPGEVQWQLRRSSPIPEPGSAALFGLALAGVLVWRRRKRDA